MAKKRRGERPDGLIQVSIQIGYKPDGRPDRKYFYGHSRAEAERKRDEYKARRAAGLRLDKDITVAKWVDIFLATYRGRVNEAYLDGNAAPYKRLVKRLGNMRVADVREADLQRALDEVAGMSYSTVDKYRQAIRRVFERARKNKLIPDNPAEDLIAPVSEKGTHRALERWEVELILENWNTPASHAGLWVMLMLLCGLRRGEMMALDWDAINLEARTLEVRAVAVVKGNQVIIEQRAKTDAGLRVLPICKALYAALVSVPAAKRSGFVCLSAKGKPLTESAVSRGLETFCRVLERTLNDETPTQRGRRTDVERRKAKKGNTLPGKERKQFSFRAHDLRHTYATALYDAGVPVKAAQYFLGHADIRVTLDLYTHLSKEREAASRHQMVKYLDDWLDSRVVNSLSMELPDVEKNS
jgi:integrase